MNFFVSGVVLFLTWLTFGLPVLGLTGLWVFAAGIVFFFFLIYLSSYRDDKEKMDAYNLELARKAQRS